MTHQQNNQPKKTVLVADRDPQLAQDIASRCERMGMQVVTANDTTSVIRLLNERIPDLLMVDHGLLAAQDQAIRDIWRVHDKHSRTPVIVLCKTDDMKSIQRYPELFAYYCRTIPYVWKNIEMFIHELVDTGSVNGNQSTATQNLNFDNER
jgi:DNA-binding response OmpR family regulator